MTERAKLYPANPHKEGTITTNATARTQNPYINYVENNTFRSGVQIVWWTNTTVNAQNGVITINTAAWWDSVWEIGNVSSNGPSLSNAIKPVSENISKDLYLPEGNVYHDGYTQIRTLWNISAERTSDIYITPVGVSIGEMANKTAWLWVHWPITVGKYITQTTPIPWWWCRPGTERNTISIYASWAAWTDNFEILWSPRILLWVKNGWYLYFDDNSKLWVNTTTFNASSTLNVNGPVKIGNDCNNRSCWETNKWEIRYYEKDNVWHFVWCTYTSDWYKWRELTIGTNNQTVSSTNNCNSYSTPYNSQIYESTIAQQTSCSY